ncbi:hypothetical protein Hanom_Chr05g00435241 [Helianthus anomalus]
MVVFDGDWGIRVELNVSQTSGQIRLQHGQHKLTRVNRVNSVKAGQHGQAETRVLGTNSNPITYVDLLII